ncbi:uncharacterized protein bcl2l12 [Polymixia lowei]
MSESAGRPSSVSSVSSISLVEIKADTRLVLKAFLHQSLSIPLAQRPGRVGGTYRDPSKYIASSVKPRAKAKDELDSQEEDFSSGDEKKIGFKDFMKRLSVPSTIRRSAKDPPHDHKDHNNSPDKDGLTNGVHPGLSHLRDQLEDDVLSPSSTSEEDDSERKQQKKLKKKKKLKTQISEFFRKRLEKEKERQKEEKDRHKEEKDRQKEEKDRQKEEKDRHKEEKDRQKEEKERQKEEKDRQKEKEKEKEQDTRPQRPSTLSINKGPEPAPAVISPNHPPEFYQEVAERLGKIAQRSHSIKRPSPSPQRPPEPSTSPVRPPPVCDKDAVVRQLVQVLSMEGDAINIKIQSDPFLRSSLSRLSYPSFARLLDTFSNREADMAPPLQSQASPTLRRVAVTMEVSRRVVTATGTQRMQGYAERYMETFAPWVKSHGGWENIVHFEEAVEYD